MPTALQIVPTAFSRIYPAYVGYGSFTEAAAKVGGFSTYRLNSIYDPDFSGVGSTAIGYTTLATAYALFRIVRARVVVRIFLTSTGAGTVGVLPGLNSSYTSVISTWEAQPNAHSKFVQGNTGGARSVGEFDITYDLAKIAGVTTSQYKTDFDFSHLAGSNPAKSLFVSVFGVGNSTAVQSFSWSIRIVYEVEASQPLQTLTS
jgi:hypothetical protein